MHVLLINHSQVHPKGVMKAHVIGAQSQTVGSNLGYNLRNRQDYIEPRCRLELYKRSFFPSSISLWNSLQIEIRAIDSLNSFKKVISKEVSKVPSHYLSGERKWPVVLSRIRNGCSNLNNDLQQNHLSFISNMYLWLFFGNSITLLTWM